MSACSLNKKKDCEYFQTLQSLMKNMGKNNLNLQELQEIELEVCTHALTGNVIAINKSYLSHS